MDALNNYISNESLIKSLCLQNKKHIAEIDRLQKLNQQLEELVVELRNKLENLEELEIVFETIEKNTEYSDKEMTAAVRKLDYIKTIKKQNKRTLHNYIRMKKNYTRLLERCVKLELWKKENEKDIHAL